MKKNVRSLTLFIFIIIQASCSSLPSSFFKEIHEIQTETGAVTSELFYDSVYYSMEYYLSKHTWPASKEDLITQGMISSYKINFDNFKYFAIEPCSEKRINIHYILNQIETSKRIYHNVRGIIGIYIEDFNKVNINSGKRINCTFTIGKYPYTSQSTGVTDGYNVHIYIENSDPDSTHKNNFTIVNYQMTKTKVLNSK